MRFKLSGAQRPLLLSGAPISLNFTISARIRGTWTLEALRGALERLGRRHPLLAVRAEADGADLYFTTQDVPPIPLRVIERKSENAWVREVEREIVQPSAYRTGPLLRCVWLRGTQLSDLILVCDHVTADGRACLYALQDLLSLLADPGLVLEPLVPPRLGDLIPPHMLPRIAEIIAAGAQARPAAHPSGLASTNPLRVIPFALEVAETSALLARCRAEGVTVQAALCAAFSLPFAERQPDVPVRRVESPFDLRRRLQQPVGEVYGNYISLLLTRLDCAPGRPVWDIARDAGRDLAASGDERIFTVPIVILSVADRPIPMAAVDVCYDLSISNLGRVDLPVRYGALRLESIFAPTFNASLPGHRILGVNTFDGRMRCTFTSCDPEAPQIVRRARQIMAAMCAPAN